MNVLAWTPNLTPARAAERGARCAATMDELLNEADILSLHAPLNEQSRGCIGARELGLMKPSHRRG
jgi:phosphoglycerate dehydrogenase-like enzyme